jgi:hypothetical protein
MSSNVRDLVVCLGLPLMTRLHDDQVVGYLIPLPCVFLQRHDTDTLAVTAAAAVPVSNLYSSDGNSLGGRVVEAQQLPSQLGSVRILTR